jgi:hypothetical protein
MCDYFSISSLNPEIQVSDLNGDFATVWNFAPSKTGHSEPHWCGLFFYALISYQN